MSEKYSDWEGGAEFGEGDCSDQKGREGEEVWEITSGRGNDAMKEGWG